MRSDLINALQFLDKEFASVIICRRCCDRSQSARNILAVWALFIKDELKFY